MTPFIQALSVGIFDATLYATGIILALAGITAYTGSARATANDTITNITLTPGQTATAYTFGELASTSISGRVFVDGDNDGIADAADTGIPGVTVTLTGTDDLGNPVTLTTTTDLAGGYGFAGLRPGTYAVTETQPAGYLDGIDMAGAAVESPATTP